MTNLPDTCTTLDEAARGYNDRGTLGILIDDAARFAHLGATRVIGGHEWIVPHVAGRRVYPVLCGDVVMHRHEDGISDGRCGYPIVAGGTGCPAHDLGPDHHKTCEHGLSLALCAGPMHYPPDPDWD